MSPRDSTPGVIEDTKLDLRTIDTDLKVIEDVAVIENRPEKEKALVRKIDIRMMPLLCVLCKYAVKRKPAQESNESRYPKLY